MDEPLLVWLLGSALLIVQVMGLATAVHAVMSVRTAQGAIAWSIALVSFPLLALPLYWVFGRNRFLGYVQARRGRAPDFADIMIALRSEAANARHAIADLGPEDAVFERLAAMPFTRGNDIALLIDGAATFDAMFQAIAAARSYVLVQFYTVEDDALGMELQRRLIASAQAGVRVCLLYDEIGSLGLSSRYLDTLRQAGVSVAAFEAMRGMPSRFQINFRNHRKILIVDGHTAFIGGHNVGDDYMGRNPRIGHWRDTHVRITGPAAIEAQLVFAEDWNWATGAVPALNWQPAESEDADKVVLVLPHGPSDDIESCGLFFTEAINGEEGSIRIDYTSIGEDDNAAVTAVTGDVGAMGYVPFSFYQEAGDAVKGIAVDGGNGCAEPTAENVQDGSYSPLGRALYVYASGTALQKPETVAFFDFYINNSAQIAEIGGYIGLTPAQVTEQLAKVASLAGQ